MSRVITLLAAIAATVLVWALRDRLPDAAWIFLLLLAVVWAAPTGACAEWVRRSRAAALGPAHGERRRLG